MTLTEKYALEQAHEQFGKPRAGEHTKGPWSVSPCGCGDKSCRSAFIEPCVVAVQGACTMQDARRIVACVNACEGIATIFLEHEVESGNPLTMIAELASLRERERELVETLQLAEALRPKMLKDFGYVPEYVLDFCNKARALAKHGR